MKYRSLRRFIALLLFLISTTLLALPDKWQIIPDQSSIRFTATQNNAPVQGSFDKFTGQINFDPNHVSMSKVHIVIDMNSLSTSFNELTETLTTAEWFDVKTFPKAEFDSKKFNQISNGVYSVKGNLTIRDKTVPVNIQFNIKKDNKNNLAAQGELIVKRSSFGIGRGEWSSTKEIKDEVKIDFTITARKI